MLETITMDQDFSQSCDEDTRLVKATRQNPENFQFIYEKWLPRIYRYFFFRVGNAHDAEDLTSQVFLNAYETFPRYREMGYFSAWLFSIAHSRMVDFFRKTRGEKTLSEVENISAESDPATQILEQDELTILFRLLKKISPEDQELIRLRYVVGLSYVEIGSILNRREDSVRKAVNRIILRLQAQLEVNHE